MEVAYKTVRGPRTGTGREAEQQQEAGVTGESLYVVKSSEAPGKVFMLVRRMGGREGGLRAAVAVAVAVAAGVTGESLYVVESSEAQGKVFMLVRRKKGGREGGREGGGEGGEEGGREGNCH